MILHDILKTENHEAYQYLQSENLERQYDFLRSIINAAVRVGHLRVSETIIKSLNYHAISCRHHSAGEYRRFPVRVGDFEPPTHDRVPGLMNELVDTVNHDWDKHDPITLSSYCLWRLNNVHTFINGNGRTARALCYYVLCVSLGGALPGAPIMPELIRQNRNEYVNILRTIDATATTGNGLELSLLNSFVGRLVLEQINSAEQQPNSSDGGVK